MNLAERLKHLQHLEQTENAKAVGVGSELGTSNTITKSQMGLVERLLLKIAAAFVEAAMARRRVRMSSALRNLSATTAKRTEYEKHHALVARGIRHSRKNLMVQ